MSLLERRLEVERQEAAAREKKKLDAKQGTANRILDGFKNKELVNLVEENLVKHGRVYVTGFGCLCESGACSDQAGFPAYLTGFEKEWKDKGASVHYSIPGVCLTLEGASRSQAVPHINHKTLETQRKWY